MIKSDSVRNEMYAAMKSGMKERKEALALLLAALKKEYIDARRDLTEDEENDIIRKEIKTLQEAIAMAPADKTDFINKNKFTLSVMQEFMPAQLTSEEIESIVKEVLSSLNIDKPEIKDKGRIMKELMPKVKGKADGKLVNDILGKFF